MTLNIMVVDDDEVLREELAIWLRNRGHVVKTVESGAAALRAVERDDFDLVITDLKMPGVDGIGVLKGVKERKPGTSVVMITGYASIDTAVEALRHGAADYIMKPFEPNQLTRVLDDVDVRTRHVRALGGYEVATGDDIYGSFGRMTRDMPGMVVSTRDPADVIGAQWLGGSEVVWVDPDQDTGPSLDLTSRVTAIRPQRLSDLESIVVGFLREHDRCVVLWDCMEALVACHSFEKIKEYFSGVSAELGPHSHFLMVVDRGVIPEDDMETLRHLISSPYLKSVTDALGNSMRRDTLMYLSKNPMAIFSDIMRALRAGDDSPKLSFHLRRLASEGLLSKDGDKRYSLTEMGENAARYLETIEDDGIKSLQNNITLTLR